MVAKGARALSSPSGAKRREGPRVSRSGDHGVPRRFAPRNDRRSRAHFLLAVARPLLAGGRAPTSAGGRVPTSAGGRVPTSRRSPRRGATVIPSGAKRREGPRVSRSTDAGFLGASRLGMIGSEGPL